ncbi:MAG: efflux RND transporter periplasmic adaptor subunit [Nitrospirales bacterium]
MKRIRQHPILTLIAILTLVFIGVLAFRLTSIGAKRDARPGRVITVSTVAPAKQDVDVRLSHTADIQPYQQVTLFSRVDGYIAKLHVDKGDFVRANQVLLEIDHTDYVHAVNQAKANLAAARAKVVRQQATVRNASLTRDRMRALIKQQFVSPQDLDTAEVNYDMAVADLTSLEAQVDQLDVALQQAERNLTYSYIRAPFPGYVAQRNLDLGAYVTGSTASTSTMSRGILTLHDIDTIRILVDVVEKDIPSLKIGQRAIVRTDAYPDRIFEGQVARIVQALNRETRTMTVEVDLPNPDHALMGGMFARVAIIVGLHPQALLIPLDAITRLEDEQFVFVVRQGRARRVTVSTGSRQGNWIEITRGLDGTEQVIVSGKDLVSEGVPVEAHSMQAS